MHPIFGIQEVFVFGWHKVRAHSALIFQVMLTLFSLQVVSSIVSKVLEGTMLGFLAGLALTAAGVILGVGMTVVSLKLARGEHAHYKDLLPKAKLVWIFFAASVITGLVTLVGFLLLIVPGIYLVLRWSMVRFCVIDGDDILESIEHSGKLTRGVKWQIFLFFIVAILINLVGALLFFIGLLVTIPVTLIAYAHVYQKLKSHHHPHHG